MYLAGLLLVISVIEGGSDEHATASAAAARHPTISGAVGTPIETSLPCVSTGIKDNRGSRGIHRFSVSGPRGQGQAVVEIKRLGLGGTPSRTYKVLSIEWSFAGKKQKLALTEP